MTIVVVSFPSDETKIVAFADSMLTDRDLPVSEAASKLLPVTVRIRDKAQRIVFEMSFGLGFAGSSLVANSTYAFSNAALQSLRLDDEKASLSFEDISKFIALVSKRYIEEIGQRQLKPQAAAVQILTFGFCPKERRRRIFKMEAQFEPSFVMTFGELPMYPNIAHPIGSPDAVEAFVREASGGKAGGEAVNFLIRSTEIQTVGGELQVMLVDAQGARVVPTLHRVESGGGKIRLLNYDIEELGEVGNCHFRNEAYGLFDG